MKRNNFQFERQVDLDRRIRAGEFPSCLTLVAVWEVSGRTIKRDIEFMRDRLGAPIEYDRKRRGYYYAKTWSFPMVASEKTVFSLQLTQYLKDELLSANQRPVEGCILVVEELRAESKLY